MKFTSDQLTEALKAKMTITGKKLAVSDRTIKAQAERICKRIEKAGQEPELDDVVAEYLPDMEEIDANMRNDNSVFIKEWEKTHAQPQPQPETRETAKPQKDVTPTDKRIDALMKEIQGIKADWQADRDREAAKAKAAELRNTLSQKGIKDSKWIDAYTRKLNVNKDTNVDAEATDALSLYNLSRAQGSQYMATPDNGGGTPTPQKPDFSDVARMRKRARGEA